MLNQHIKSMAITRWNRWIGGTYHIYEAYISGLCKGISLQHFQNMAKNMVLMYQTICWILSYSHWQIEKLFVQSHHFPSFPQDLSLAQVNLRMKTIRNGEVATYDLPQLTYSFMVGAPRAEDQGWPCRKWGDAEMLPWMFCCKFVCTVMAIYQL